MTQHTTLRDLLADAIVLWEDLTGTTMDATTWRMGDWDVRNMNEALKETLALDPEGATTAMMLESFLRAYLEDKTFTAAQNMKDYKATTAYLQKAETLFSLIQSELVTAATAAFRARVLEGARRYGALTPDVEALANDPDALPFLRRDALFAIKNLHPYQFLQGERDTNPAQMIPFVHQAWNITAMLQAVRGMPVSGIALVLLRDPTHTDRSFFGFAMRNGENVMFLTDKRRPAYPGQEDVMADRGSRGTGRTYAKRAWRNRFPYQIIKTSVDEDGDLVFEKETAPVLAGKDIVAMMHFKDLPADQVLWLTMLLALVAETFWTKAWEAPALSYTGAMVTDKDAMLKDKHGALVVQKEGYTPIAVDTLTHDDVGAEGFEAVLPGVSKGIHRWLEDRYAARVPQGLFNLWAQSNTTLAIPAPPDRFGSMRTPVATPDANGLISIPNTLSQWERPRGYAVQAFSSGTFGTEKEIQEDRVWIARKNMATYIQKLANEEFEDRKAKVLEWVQGKTTANLDTLLGWIHDGDMPAHPDPKVRQRRLRVLDVKSSEWSYSTYPNLVVASDSVERRCAVTQAKPTWRARFAPADSHDLALLCDVKVDQLPDVLQNWARDEPYVGNSILDRLDPMDAHLDNPWRKLDLAVNVFLSKRAFSKIGGTPTAQ